MITVWQKFANYFLKIMLYYCLVSCPRSWSSGGLWIQHEISTFRSPYYSVHSFNWLGLIDNEVSGNLHIDFNSSWITFLMLCFKIYWRVSGEHSCIFLFERDYSMVDKLLAREWEDIGSFWWNVHHLLCHTPAFRIPLCTAPWFCFLSVLFE